MTTISARLRRIGTRLTKCGHSPAVFLAGSGVSVPSGLPAAYEITSTLAKFLSDNQRDADGICRHLAPIVTPTGPQVNIRFERVLQVVRDVADKNLAVLRCLEFSTIPTGLHHFLAAELHSGTAVFTTNFDSLIERSFLARYPAARLRVVDREYPCRTNPECSFRRGGKRKQEASVLFKLHGSLRAFSHGRVQSIGRWQTHAVGATLDSIGKASLSACLEPGKEGALRSQLRKHVLVVLGYSGLDDFDVIPTLTRLAEERSIGAVIWISHRESGRIRVSSLSNRGGLLKCVPGPLLHAAAAARIPVCVVQGNTQTIVSHLFGFRFQDSAGAPNPDGGGKHFDGRFFQCHMPYAKLTKTHRLFTLGRLSESAGDYFRADKLYRRIGHARNGQVIVGDLRIRALALSRRGYIQWLRGKNSKALAFTHAAMQLLPRRHSGPERAAFINQLGFVNMSIGKLALAMRLFRRALREYRSVGNRENEAKILANIAIVFRRQGNYSKSEEYSKKAFEVSQSIRDRDGMARALGNQANAYHGQGRFKEALDAALQSYQLAEQLGNKQVMAVQMGNVGIFRKRLHQPNEALGALRQALRMNRAIKRAEGIHDVTSEIGSVYGEMKQYVRALKYLNNAIAMAQKNGDVEGLAEDYEMRADVRWASNQKKRAVQDLLRSRRLFIKLGNRQRSNELRSRIAKLDGS